MEAPLAERIRPQQLEDYISQTHLIGPEGFDPTNRKGIIPSQFFGATGTQTIAQESTPLFSY
jgi:putative ATPase